MEEDVTFPVGTIVKSLTTREQSLFSLLEWCRRESFQGYIAIYFYKFGSYYEGYIVLKKGEPILAIARFDRLYKGEEAYSKIMDEVATEICNVDLHEYKTVNYLLRSFPDAALKAVRGIGGLDAIRWKMNELKILRRKMEEWRNEGWDVRPLEEILEDEDLDFVKRVFETFERDVATMKELRDRLRAMDTTGFERERKEIERLIPYVHKKLIVRRKIIELENKISQERKKKEKADIDEITVRFTALMHYWKSQGYNVQRLETALKTGNPETIKLEFKLFEKDISALKKLRSLIEKIETKRFSTQKAQLMGRTYDPANIPSLKEEIYLLGLRVAAEETAHEIRPERPRKVDNRVKKKVRKEKRVKQGGKRVKKTSTPRPERTPTRRKESTKVKKVKEVRRKQIVKKKTPSRVRSVLESMEEWEALPIGIIQEKPEREQMPEHLKRFTFETFVVDETNRFAQAAAFAVAQEPGKTYNPLFIHSPTGLGKTHLLGAIYNYINDVHPKLKVIYRTSEEFTDDVIDAIRTPYSDSLEKYDKADVLLIDDIQFLAGKESVQERFFQLFNAFHAQGKQIVITSDRPPKELTTLEARLRTRFEGGLIADIQPPSLELRTAILIKKAAAMGLVLPADVIEYIAVNITSSIRELEGALAKIHAGQTLSSAPMTLERAKDLLKDFIEAEKRESGEEVKWGFSYLLEGASPDRCYSVFTDLLNGASGLCISRTNPRHLRDAYDLWRSQILWLTDISNRKGTISSSLEEIMEVITKFTSRVERVVLLIDGLEYLIHKNGFGPVLNFLRTLKDDVSERNAILLLPVNPNALKREEVASLERELIPLR